MKTFLLATLSLLTVSTAVSVSTATAFAHGTPKRDRPIRLIDVHVGSTRVLGYKFNRWFRARRWHRKVSRNLYEVRGPMMVYGQQFDKVAMHVDAADKLVGITMTTAVSGNVAGHKLSRWVNRVCSRYTRRVNRRMPSPLGTPTPGKRWNPVFTSRGHCGGASGGVNMQLRERKSWAKKSARATVTIHFRWAPKGP